MAAVAGTKVGTGYVEIRPDFSGFQKAVGKKLNETLAPAMQKVGQGAGKEIAKGAERGNLQRSLSPLLKRFEAFGGEANAAIVKGMQKRRGRGQAKAIAAGLGLDEMSSFFDRAKKDAERGLSPIERIASRVRGRLRGLKTDFRGVGGEIRQLAGTHLRGLTGELKRVSSEFQKTDRRARVTSSGFGGFDGVMSRVNRGAQFFRNVLRTIKWPVFIAGLGLSLQGLSALAAGAVATAGSLGRLSGALVILPALALTAAQAFSVLKLATAGIGDALKAGLDAEIQGGAQAVDTMRQQEDAAERVADAKRNLTSVQKQALTAQEDLTQAREDARRELEDMRLASEASRDSEQAGSLSLIQARKDLARTLRDADSSGLDIRFAEEAVDQARNDLEGTRLEAKRTREDYRKAQQDGVKGMPGVVAAEQAKADAKQAVTDAERDLTKAVRDSTDAMKEQGSAASAFQDKMSQLPPAAQKFVRVLLSMKPRLDELRSTAASNFFPGAESGLKGLMGNFGRVKAVVGDTAGTIGRVAAKAGKKLGSAVWGKDLSRLGELNTRILDRMGVSGLNLADTLRHVLVTAEPFLDWLSASGLKLTEWVKGEAAAGRETGRLGAFFDRTRQTMERLGPILKGVGGAFLNISKASDDLGNDILISLGGAAEGWRKWTDSVQGQNRLKNYFTETQPAIFEMGRLVRDAGKAFFELGKQDGVAHLLRMVRVNLVPALRDLVGATTGWASGFMKQFGRLRREGVPTFDAFLQTLVEHAGEAGVKIAKGLVTGFVNSDILGKLAIGGWLFAKFGGLGAFGGVGKGAGMKFAKGFIAGVLLLEMGKKLKEIAEGEKLGAPKSELFMMDFKKFFSDPKVGLDQRGQVEFSTAFGKLIFNPVTRRVVEAQGERLKQLVGSTLSSKLAQSIKSMEAGVGDGTGGVVDRFRDKLRPLAGTGGKSIDDATRAMLPKLDTLAVRGGRKADEFADRVGGAFNRLTGTATTAMETLGFNVSQMLKTLGGKAPQINLKKALGSLPELKPMGNQLKPVGRQTGGLVPAFATGGLASMVPGDSTGDRHTLSLNGTPVAKVESREGIFVGNRNLMARMQEANARVPRFQRGGLVDGAVQRLRRGGLVEPKLAGEGGALKDLGQSAIHKVFEGAKDFVEKHRPQLGGGMTGSGPVEAVFAKVAKALSKSKIATLALGMAGFAESRMRDLPFGDSSSEGPLQLLASTAAAFGIDPHDEAAVSSHFLLRGFYGRGGANKLAAQGLPAHLVAQNVQGSAFSDGSNYLAQEASAKGWMKRFGLQAGGLIKLAKGGELGNPFNAQAMRGGPALGASLLSGLTGFKPKTIGRIKSKAEAIANAFTGYVWGGGHSEGTNVTANGLDCSGAIAKLMQQAGWPEFAVGHSSEYASRFMSGEGDLFTIWSNNDHTFADVEGQQWGTNTSTGLGYHSHTHAGFTPRHPQLAPEGATGTAATGPEAKPKEDIPDSYKGAKAGAQIDFGSMPKDLEGVKAEIKKWHGQVSTYRKAKAHAERNGKPGVAQAIGRNLSAIEQRLAGLRQLQTRLRLQGAKKALKKRLGGAFGKMAGYDQMIEGAQREYLSAAQNAEQVVALEPQSPELPATATDAQRESAEKAYVSNFSNYVDGPERSAYGRVLETVAEWRNRILKAEKFGFGDKQPSVARMQTGWEGEARKATSGIEQIKEFAAKVKERIATFKRENPKAKELPDWLKLQIKKRDDDRQELPLLQLKNSKLREAVGKAREAFFPGGANRLIPPTLPLPGSGSLEEKLTEVQGIHWPDQHEVLPAGALAPPRVAGRFGGVVWDVQSSIEELGLKLRQTSNGLGGGGSDGDGEADNSLLEELLRQANQRNLLRGIEERVFSGMPRPGGLQIGGPALPFAGTFHSGGVTPGPRNQESVALVRGGEPIFTPDQAMALGSAIREPSEADAPLPQVKVIVEKGAGVDISKIRTEIAKADRRGARGAARKLAPAGVFAK